MNNNFTKRFFGGIYASLIALFTLCSEYAKGDTIAFFYALDADVQSLKSEAQPVGQPLKVGSRSIAVLQIASHRVYAEKKSVIRVRPIAGKKYSPSFLRLCKRARFGSAHEAVSWAKARKVTCLLVSRPT